MKNIFVYILLTIPLYTCGQDTIPGNNNPNPTAMNSTEYNKLTEMEEFVPILQETMLLHYQELLG